MSIFTSFQPQSAKAICQLEQDFRESATVGFTVLGILTLGIVGEKRLFQHIQNLNVI